MSDDSQTRPSVVFQSSRFGTITVPEESLIEFPSGVIGFPRYHRFVMLDHKPPFSWLHSVDNAELAFVVVDGFQFEGYDLTPPIGDRDAGFKEDDEYAILVIVTVRSDPRMTTANLKAPLFVNLRNRKGIQVIFDDARYSTRHPIWPEEEKADEQSTTVSGKDAAAENAAKPSGEEGR